MIVKNVITFVDCPYCGHRNKVGKFDITSKEVARGKIVVCNLEEGGCDKAFVVKFDVAIKANRYKLVTEDE